MNLFDAYTAIRFVQTCLLFFGLATTGYASPINLLANPSFETGDFTGWEVGGSSQHTGVSLDGTTLPLAPYFVRNAVNAHSGVYAGHALVRNDPPGVQPTPERISLTQSVDVPPNRLAWIGYHLGGEVATSYAPGYGTRFGNGFAQIYVDGVGLLATTRGINIVTGTGPADFTIVQAPFHTGSRSRVEVRFDISGGGTERTNVSFDDFFLVTPEPAGAIVFSSGAAALGLVMRRRR